MHTSCSMRKAASHPVEMTANRARPAGAAAHLAPVSLTKTTETKELVSKAPLIMSGLTSRTSFSAIEKWLCFALPVDF
jgi:hypothetical protein